MAIGIRNIFVTAAAFSKTSDATPAVITGLSANIAANQTMKIRVVLPLTIGAAAGGWRFQVVVPAAGTAFNMAATVYDETTNAIIACIKQVASAVANGVGIAADGYIVIDATIVNGANAGTVEIHFAQSASNGAASTVDRGAVMETTQF